MTYTELIARSQNWPIKYEWAKCPVRSLKTQFSEHPWSIAECESEFMYRTIIERNCKSGLEIGTGTGVSAIIAGRAFRENHGTLVTLDPFIEEYFGRCDLYSANDRQQSLSGVGKYISEVLKDCDLEGHVKSIIGWSPQDVGDAIEKGLAGNPLDYVFIDARHCSDSTRRDFDAVLPFLDHNCILFFHDTCCIDDATQSYIQDNFRSINGWIKPDQFKSPNGFNLTYLER